MRTFCGAQYLLVEVAVSERGALDWREIERELASFAGRVLFPDSLEVPEDVGLRPPRCERFGRAVLLRTACEIIVRTKMPMYRRILGLVDNTGEYADFLYDLLKYYTSVKVVTQAADVYTDAAQDVMERLGAPVFVGAQLESLAECVLILAPDPANLPASFRPECPVLTGSDTLFAPGGWDIFSSLRVRLSGEALAGVPPGISPHLLAGALYEWEGKLVTELVAGKLLYNCKNASLAEAAEIVSRRAGTFSLI
jgi:hypothetical protein